MGTEEVQIQRARAQHVEPMAALFAMEWEEERAGAIGLAPHVEQWKSDLRHAIYMTGFGVAVSATHGPDETVLGAMLCYYTTVWGQSVLREGGWYVHPSFRGYGVGFRMLDRAIEEARKDGLACSFGVGTRIGNNTARLLEKYQERGFAPFSVESFLPLQEVTEK